MTPTTPSGVATRSMTSPLGRAKVASTRPTGSGRAATSSRPRAIPTMRSGLSASRSSKAALKPFALASARSRALAARTSADRSRNARAAAVSARFLAPAGALASLRAAARASLPTARIAARTSASGSMIWTATDMALLTSRDRPHLARGKGKGHSRFHQASARWRRGHVDRGCFDGNAGSLRVGGRIARHAPGRGCPRRAVQANGAQA